VGTFATKAAVKASTLAQVVRFTWRLESLMLSGRRITVIMTRKTPREKRKRRRNLLGYVSIVVGVG
jgi:hypothetical protein